MSVVVKLKLFLIEFRGKGIICMNAELNRHVFACSAVSIGFDKIRTNK